MSEFMESGDSRETDPAIMQAIYFCAQADTATAIRIWENPTPEEVAAVWEIVTGNGLLSSTLYCWGDAGSDWNEGELE